jgi:hypothetical protein
MHFWDLLKDRTLKHTTQQTIENYLFFDKIYLLGVAAIPLPTSYYSLFWATTPPIHIRNCVTVAGGMCRFSTHMPVAFLHRCF